MVGVGASAITSLVSATGYLVGTGLLIPGTVMLLDQFKGFYNLGITFLVVATAILTVTAIVDFVVAIMTVFSGRTSSKSDVGKKLLADSERLLPRDDLGSPPQPQLSDLLGPFCMLGGGVFFLIASVLYLPQLGYRSFADTTLANLGTWIFRIGSIFYLGGSVRGLYSVSQAVKDNGSSLSTVVTVTGIMAYVVGAIMYITGGILSQKHSKGFAETWVVGSAFFVFGAVLLWSVTVCGIASKVVLAHQLSANHNNALDTASAC